MLTLETFLEDFKAFEKSHILNGTLAIGVGNRIVYSKCSGMADFAENVPCALETQYNIASVSKQFTAAALLRVLYEANPSLDELQKTLQNPISNFLPTEDFIWDSMMPEWAATITLHQLLTHTSGIVNYTDMDSFWEGLYRAENPSMVDLVRLFKGEPLNFEPGTRYEYSNSGYTLLGLIIERLAKKALSDYLKDIFFIPLGMKNTHLPTQGTSLTLKKTMPYSHLARGYLFDIKSPAGPYTEIKHYWPYSIDLGDGGIISTAPDLIKWNNALHHGHVLHPHVLELMLNSYARLETEPDVSHGYGIVSRKTPYGTMFIHGGSVPGYHTYPIFIPALDLTIISMTNVTFDGSCIKDEKQTIRRELSHMEDGAEKEKKYDELFSKRYPEIEKIREQHSLFKIKDIKF